MTTAPPVLLRGRYELGALLGDGRRGRTYVATDRVLAREVVVLVLADGHAPEPGPWSVLAHPGLVTVLDVGAGDGRRFVVTELVRGRSLARATADGPLDVPRLVVVGALVADALGHAHAQGVVHGDLSAHDVLLGDDGRVKVAGLGGAALTSTPADDVRTLGEVLLASLDVAPGRPPDHLRSLLDLMTAEQADDRPTAAAVAFQLRRPTGPPVLAERTLVRLPAVPHEPVPEPTRWVDDVRLRLGGVDPQRWGVAGAGLVLVVLLAVAALAR